VESPSYDPYLILAGREPTSPGTVHIHCWGLIWGVHERASRDIKR
jgi:hypothetical protein